MTGDSRGTEPTKSAAISLNHYFLGTFRFPCQTRAVSRPLRSAFRTMILLMVVSYSAQDGKSRQMRFARGGGSESRNSENIGYHYDSIL